jgi:hypothetical protein
MWIDGKKILLRQMLESLEYKGELGWVIDRLSGVGKRVLGMSFCDLEERIASSPNGVRISSKDLWSFAGGIEDLDYLELTGFVSAQPVVRLECFDSSWWTVDYEPNVVSVMLPSSAEQ